MERAVLHDRLEVGLGLLQDIQVLQRISVDHEEVGACSRRHHAYLTFHSEQLRRVYRGGANDIDRGLHLAANSKLKKLVAEQALDLRILKEVAEGKW